MQSMNLISASKKTLIARTLAVLTVLFGVSFYVIEDMIKPGYSSLSQYISELNATGSAWAWQIGYFGFVPLGMLLAAYWLAANALIAVDGVSRLGWWLLWSLPLAFIGVALAPCDLGCPMEGSIMQTIHALNALLTYFATALGLCLISFAARLDQYPFARLFLRGTSIAFVVLFVVMLLPQVAAIRGLLQRTADALLAVCILLIAWRLLLDYPVPMTKK
jgi:hypothetical protein